MNSALESLQGTYTDSEGEDNPGSIDYSDPEEKQTKAEIIVTKKSNSKVTRLVSYNDHELHEDASDDEANPADESKESKDETTKETEDKLSFYEKKYGFSLPVEPRTKPDPKLQETITNIYQKINISNFDLNKYIQSDKKFRNPSIYDKLIQYLELNELGTNFDPEVYDVSVYGPDSFYEELAKAQKLEMDKLEKQKKENIKTEVIQAAKESAKRKSKWDQQAPSSVTGSVTASSTSGKTTVINAFGTLKKPKV